MRKTNKPLPSLSRLTCYMQEKYDMIVVVLGIITDDNKIYELPPMKITTLRFIETTRA